MSPAEPRPRSTASASLPVEAPVIIKGMARRIAGRNAAGSQVTGSTAEAAVEISAAPMILLANSSGCWSASAITVMPPIECPTSTTGVLPGAVAFSTACRSAPSWSMLISSGSDRPERPWPRWSQNTSRPMPLSPACW